jgi:hypothetical protein
MNNVMINVQDVTKEEIVQLIIVLNVIIIIISCIMVVVIVSLNMKNVKIVTMKNQLIHTKNVMIHAEHASKVETQLLTIVIHVLQDIISFMINQVGVLEKEVNQIIHISMKKIILIIHVIADVVHAMEEDHKQIITVNNALYMKMEHSNIISQLIKNINV